MITFLRRGRKKLKTTNHSPNQKTNFKQNPNASAQIMPQTKIHQPNALKPPFPQHSLLSHPFQPSSYSPDLTWQRENCHHHHHPYESEQSRPQMRFDEHLTGFIFAEILWNHPSMITTWKKKKKKKKKALNPLITLKTFNTKDVTNPYLFRGALMVTTFVRSSGTRTRELWRFIEEASRADIRLAELEYSCSIKWYHSARAGSRFIFTCHFTAP